MIRLRLTRAAWLWPLMVLFAPAGAVELHVVGTDLLGVDFSKACYRFAGRADLTLALAFDGSRPGLDTLKAGRADLALLVFAPGEEVGAAALERLTVAYHRVVVVAPAAVALEQLTLEQLAGVFGAGGALNVTRWGELGVEGPAAANVIAPLAPGIGRGVVDEFFRSTVLRGRAFKSEVLRFETSTELTARLAGDSRVLALAPAAPAGAKVLAVATRAGEPAFLPTPENLGSGDYPLRLALQVVFRRESAKAVRPLLAFLFSEEAAPLFERAGLAPLPAASRRQQVQALEKL